MITYKKARHTVWALGLLISLLTACEGNKYVHDDLDNVSADEITSAADSAQVIDTTYNNP